MNPITSQLSEVNIFFFSYFFLINWTDGNKRELSGWRNLSEP